MEKLEVLGWSDFYQAAFKTINHDVSLKAGRIGIEYNNYYMVHTEYGEMLGEASGKLLFEAEGKSELPKVGDWVIVDIIENESSKKCIIHAILPRRTFLSRKIAGSRVEEQIIVANLDVVFIVQGMDGDFNLNRLERYLPMIYEGGMEPIIVLNKNDLSEDVGTKIDKVRKSALHVKIISTSAITKSGMDELRSLIKPGFSYAFVGSSGAGKSTLINILLGQEVQMTNEVRESDSRGRHTTTRREMIIMPSGGILFDTPGMRELQIWDVEDGIRETFEDVHLLARNCHFTDCMHISEIKCAVKAAVESGELPEKRYKNYLKMKKEQVYLESRISEHAMIAERQRKKKIQKSWRNIGREIKKRKTMD